MNERRDKVELLKAIAAGEIDPKQLASEPVIVSDGKETFVGLMISMAHHKAGKQSPVIYVGEAKIQMEECLANIKAKRNEK